MKLSRSPSPIASNSTADNHDRIVLAGLLLVAFVLVARYLQGEVPEWHLTHWLFSYQDGLLSRALVGSLGHVLLGEHRGSALAISTMSWAATAGLVALLAIVGFRYWRNNARTNTALLEAAVLVACPGTIQFLCLETGRLDQVGYLIGISVCLALPKIRAHMQWVTVSMTSVVLCLIHEALAIMLAPTLVALVLLLQSDVADDTRVLSRRVLTALVSLLPAIVLAILLTTVGRLDYDSEYVEVLRKLNEIADFQVQLGAVKTHFRTIGQNALYTLDYWTEPSRVLGLVSAFLALVPSGIVAFFVTRCSVRASHTQDTNTPSRLLTCAVVLCCLAPLALAVQGTDCGRWMAAAVTNMFLLGMIAGTCSHHSVGTCRSNATHPLTRMQLGWIALFSLAVGPVTYEAGPYALHRLVEALGAILGVV